MGALGGLFGPKHDHASLFNELCRFHQIDRKTKQLLGRIMEKYKAARPGLIFVEDTWLRKAIDDKEFQEFAEQLHELRKNWFED